MTTVHAELVGDMAVLPRSELDRLIELARCTEQVELHQQAGETPTLGIMRLAEQGGAFNWLADEDEIYSADDLKERFR